MRHFAWRWGPALLWAAAVFVLSAQQRLPQLPGVLGWDKLQHSTAFIAGGLLLARATASTRRGSLWAALLGFAYALSDELHQIYVPGRHSDPRDWLADALGVLAGIAVWRLFILLIERRARRRAPARGGRAAVTHA